ncbi:hypothetical protein HID58_058413 [Brassica napus]|uniref:Pentatricopeptide repeat-containing protein n=1 Tax=Brassica napus TaxID=3708 RepID=A0ABQ7ZQ02_BRANA|nr:hypothetical protein HID58_058413 [Brassica napus]
MRNIDPIVSQILNIIDEVALTCIYEEPVGLKSFRFRQELFICRLSLGRWDPQGEFSMKCLREVSSNLYSARRGEVEVGSTLFDEMTEVKDGVIYYVMKDGYVKSGDMTSSRRLFNEMRFRTVVTWTIIIHGYCNNKDVASWNDMINGYALNGDVSAALDLFLAMLREVKPDEVTILAVLSACNHIAEGRKWFHMMEECGLKAKIEHYGYMGGGGAATAEEEAETRSQEGHMRFGDSFNALSPDTSFCNLRFSSVRLSQHLFKYSQSTSVCFSFVLNM